MANRDIAGLLTGIPTQGISVDPMAMMTPDQQRMQMGAQAAKRMKGGIRGMLGQGDTPSEVIQNKLGELVADFANKTIEEQKNIINVLRASGQVGMAAELAAEMTKAENRRLKREAIASKKASDKLLTADRQAIRESEDKGEEAHGMVARLSGLAERYERLRPTGGVRGTAVEIWKKTLGSQDELSRLKLDFTNVQNTGIINSLPPGVASDKDIAMAASGFMDDKWNHRQISRFLRGQAKLSAFNAEKSLEKSKYLSKNYGDSSGFVDYWDAKRKEDGYAEWVRDKYKLPVYDLQEEVEFDADFKLEDVRARATQQQQTRRGLR